LPVTAGTPFPVSATAWDAFGNVKTNYTGTGASLTSTLVSSPNATSPTVPSNLTWGVGTGVGTANITATRATVTDTASTTNQNLTILSSVADGSRTATTGSFAVIPNNVATLTFTGQPIDTQVNTDTQVNPVGRVRSPVYSMCAPASDTPCALSTAATNPSSPVAVYAVDAYGNAILQKDIVISGTGLDASVTKRTNNGTATFGDPSSPTPDTALKESTPSTGPGRTLVATTSFPTVTQPSNTFRVVTALKGCPKGVTGVQTTSCIIKALGAISTTYVNSWSQITTNQTCGFFCGTTNVLQSTQLITTDKKSKCGGTAGFGADVTWVSDIVDQRVTGTNTQVTSTGFELIVIPKNTLKSSGVLSRSASNFNICFGAIWIGSGSDTPGAPGAGNGWWGKKSATDTTRTRATRVADSTVTPQQYRFFGIPADCPTAGPGADPCIWHRTKQTADVSRWLGADAAKIMSDGDIAIIVAVTTSWDGSSHPF
jgi:hypothetical protein